MRFAQPSVHWATGAQSSGTNKPACETDQSPLSLLSRLGMSGAIRTVTAFTGEVTLSANINFSK